MKIITYVPKCILFVFKIIKKYRWETTMCFQFEEKKKASKMQHAQERML